MTDYLARLRGGEGFDNILAVLKGDLPFEVVADARQKAKNVREVYERAEDLWLEPASPHDQAVDDFYVAMGDELITEEQYARACELVWNS